MVKHAGVNMGVLIPGRRPNDITLACVFCPCIGFNMPSNWKEVTPKNKLYISARSFRFATLCLLIHSFLYGPVYSGDSNYGWSKRARKDDKNDRRLAPGYWVDHPLLEKMINTSYGPDTEALDKEASRASLLLRCAHS